ncbi:holliday junction ATP-dependent DNA helicase RuvA [Clostridium acetobutylicum]|nr:holliday junction ATP-dependent DNA helicase RuvA [Clostridium acetobutylicum]OOM04681.1 holliday junction ATP-dependent DNA helicase RuvA [Clostridium acetobutylicum]
MLRNLQVMIKRPVGFIFKMIIFYLGVTILYEYIKGKYIGINKDYIIVDNNGVGYKIFTSGNTMANMPKPEEDVLIYLTQIVRQDFIGLYGFLTKDELEMFNKLLTINGVGAKASLSLLSICTVNNLKYAIITGDEKTIVKAPGIGKKTAQRIILELKDKFKSTDISKGNSEINNLDVDYDEHSKKLEEVRFALNSLGYSEKETDRAINNVDKSEGIENIIKSCLRFLMN